MIAVVVTFQRVRTNPLVPEARQSPSADKLPIHVAACFLAVHQAVAVGVGDGDRGAKPDFIAVVQTVVVRVIARGICAQHGVVLSLPAVAQAVAVGVGHVRTRAGGAGRQSVGAIGRFLRIWQAVVVQVGVEVGEHRVADRVVCVPTHEVGKGAGQRIDVEVVDRRIVGAGLVVHVV